jgi:hypothetical protein
MKRHRRRDHHRIDIGIEKLLKISKRSRAKLLSDPRDLFAINIVKRGNGRPSNSSAYPDKTLPPP